MLDTDTASYTIKGRTSAIRSRLQELDVAEVCISAVTRAELRFGARSLPQAVRLAAEVERFLSGIHALAWGEVAADLFADIRADLERKGTPIGGMDTMIAAHALAERAVLVTNNLKRFKLVTGLRCENWMTMKPPR